MHDRHNSSDALFILALSLFGCDPNPNGVDPRAWSPVCEEEPLGLLSEATTVPDGVEPALEDLEALEEGRFSVNVSCETGESFEAVVEFTALCSREEMSLSVWEGEDCDSMRAAAECEGTTLTFVGWPEEMALPAAATGLRTVAGMGTSGVPQWFLVYSPPSDAESSVFIWGSPGDAIEGSTSLEGGRSCELVGFEPAS